MPPLTDTPTHATELVKALQFLTEAWMRVAALINVDLISSLAEPPSIAVERVAMTTFAVAVVVVSFRR
jgi:hypothetical protein